MPVYNAFTSESRYLGREPANPNLAGMARFLNTGAHRGNLPSLIVEDPNTGAFGLSIPGRPGRRIIRQPRSSQSGEYCICE